MLKTHELKEQTYCHSLHVFYYMNIDENMRIGTYATIIKLVNLNFKSLEVVS